ncbi:MAG: phytoene/squalene synthase family protein [Gammaproteobacteria bacterium]|nr:phytoene/squalene synthase family protein [Gammaproteobacteria bacterium]
MPISPTQLDALSHFAEQSIAVGSKSFAGASRLFNRQMRVSAQLLYSWCRHCDDVIDGQGLGFATPVQITEGRTAADVESRLRILHEKTRVALDGKPDAPAFAALAYVVERHQIPARYPLELLDGFEMDAFKRCYHSLQDTIEYSYHVAGVVGIMMAMVMGVRDEATLDRACDLGIGFQLTNISRDVMDDAAIGRIYLPEQWLREAGVAPEEIACAAMRERVYQVVSRLLDTAEQYYDSAYYGLCELPFRAACAIGTARRVYREIGRQVRRRERNAWDQRMVVGRRRKLFGAAMAILDSTYAHSVGRLASVPPRHELWNRPRNAA